jgi:hypothetical protein
MQRKTIFGAIALAIAVGLAGCGGGGGGGQASTSGGGGGGGGGTSNMFVTNSGSTSYTHAWVTITSVDMVGTNGQITNVYNSASAGGQVVDLGSLNASTGQQFMLLTTFNPPSGTLKNVNVTVSSNLSLTESGSSSATSATFSGSKGNSAVLTATVGSQVGGGSQNMTLDFNLANWKISGGTVSASGSGFVKLGFGIGQINQTNVLAGDYFGVVSSLSGTTPTQTFTITRGRFSVAVATNTSTVLYNSDGSANPTLTNGAVVDVAGTYDAANNAIDANAIIIEIGVQAPPPARATGLVTTDSATGNTIGMQLTISQGFMPTTTALTVSVTPSTTYIDGSGVTDTESQFFANLTPGTTVIRAEGTISGSTITATSVRIVLPPGGGSTTPVLAAIRGTALNVNTTADTLTVTVKQWEGIRAHRDVEVSVITTADTQYAVDGTIVTAATFFATLNASSTVNVRGSLDPATLTLTAAIVSTGAAHSWGFWF